MGSNIIQNQRGHFVCGVGDGEGFGSIGHVFQGSGVGEELGEEFGQGGGGEFFFLNEFGGVGFGEDLGVGGLVVVGGVGEGDEDGGQGSEGYFC